MSVVYPGILGINFKKRYFCVLLDKNFFSVITAIKGTQTRKYKK